MGSRLSPGWVQFLSPFHPHPEEGGDAFGSRLPESGDDIYPRRNHTEPGGRKHARLVDLAGLPHFFL